MNLITIIREVTEAARQLGMSVRVETGSFTGGFCQVNGEEVIVLNKRHPPERQFAVLAASLRGSTIESVYLKPAVRRALEEAWARGDDGRGPGGTGDVDDA